MSIHSEENDDNQRPAAAVSDAVLNAVAADTVAVADLAVAAAVSNAVLNAVAADTVAVADLAVNATFDCDEKTETQAPSPPLPNTSAVAAATTASIAFPSRQILRQRPRSNILTEMEILL